MSNKHLKGEYNETFEVIQKIINEWDPLDLLTIDCPDDEYEFEIKRIASATLNENNAEKLAGKINDILYKAFEGDFKKKNDCSMIADKILKIVIELTGAFVKDSKYEVSEVNVEISLKIKGPSLTFKLRKVVMVLLTWRLNYEKMFDMKLLGITPISSFSW